MIFQLRYCKLTADGRQLPFTGPLTPYIHFLSYLTFTLLLHTFRTFSQSFPPASSSAVVKWAKERVDEFNENLERQLSSVERGSELWNECVATVKEQAGVLSEVSVDFTGLVAKGMDAAPERVNGGSRREPVGLGLST